VHPQVLAAADRGPVPRPNNNPVRPGAPRSPRLPATAIQSNGQPGDVNGGLLGVDGRPEDCERGRQGRHRRVHQDEGRGVLIYGLRDEDIIFFIILYFKTVISSYKNCPNK